MTEVVSAEQFFGQPKGRVFEADIPESGAPPAIGDNVVSANDFFGSEKPKIVEPRDKKNFFERFGEDLDKRREMYAEITRSYLDGEQSYAEGALQVTGKVGAGAALDFIGEALVSGGRGLSAITPDFIETPLKNAVTSAGHEFLNTRVGQKGLEAAKNGIEEWTEFKGENPRTARNIEAVVNIGLLTAPVKTKAKPKAPSVAGRASTALEQRATQQVARRRSDFVADLVRPRELKPVRIDQVTRTAEESLLKFRQKKVNLSKQEKVIAAEVSKIPGVKSTNSLQGNFNAISAAVSKESAKLETAVARQKVIFPKKELLNELDDVSAKLGKSIVIVGDAAKSSERLIQQMKTFVNQNPGTAAGVLKARKQLDSWVKSQKGVKVFDPNLDNALTVALREVRKTTNDFVAKKSPSVAVKDSLKKQSNLLRGMENIQAKAAEEASNVLLRTWKRGLRLLPLRGEFNQSMAALFAVGGLGASALFAPVFTKMMFTAGGAFGVYKGLTSVTSKRALAKVLSGVDRMIKSSKDPALIRQLRADRAAVVELMKLSKEELEE